MEILALAAIVLAAIALSRTGRRSDLAARVERLEEELERLRTATPVPGAAPQAHAGVSAEAAASDRVDVAPAPGAAEPAAARDAVPPAPSPFPAFAREAEPSTTGSERLGDESERAALDVEREGAVAPPGAGEPPGRGGLGNVDWERWLGVRGAAVLGGAVLALAGLFFFRYSIEHGLIPPWLRVVVGTLAGVAAIAGAEWSLRTRYASTANGLAGGGIVLLYAAFWAAGVLYELVPAGVLFVLLVAVTIAGCALALRHDSLAIAGIGLVGGFLTPLFASTGTDRPIGLFAYILVLDAALLAIARRKRWPALAALSLAGTALYQALWIGGRMGPDRAALGIAILAVFALLFAVASPPAAGESRIGRSAQVSGMLLPFAFALYFAASADLAVGLLPLGVLLAILGVAAGWIARRRGPATIALAAATATVGVVVVWVAQHPELVARPWLAAFVFCVLALAHHVALEMPRAAPLVASDGERRSRLGVSGDPIANAGALVAGGLLLVLVAVATLKPIAFWPTLAGWLGLAAVLVRQGTFEGRGAVQVAGAVGVALGLVAYRSAHAGDDVPDVPGDGVLLAAMLAIAVAWQGLALFQARLASRSAAEHAAAALAIVLLIGRAIDPPAGPLVGFASTFALGALVVLAATRLGGGPWMVAGVLATALAQLAWTMAFHPSASFLALALAVVSAVAFGAWPLAGADRLRDDRWSWRAAALAGPAWLPAAVVLFEDRFGDRAKGLVPIALGAATLAIAARARDLWLSDDERRTSALAWLCGAALGLATVAIPLQLERHWITVGWALEAAALVRLWTRLDHPGLKYTALALFAVVTVRLVGDADVLGAHARAAWPIVNWIAYTYLVPAAALVAAARWLRPLEVSRLREWERPLYLRPEPLAATGAGLAALVVVFVWINLTIADAFATGSDVAVVFDRTPAQNLALSIAWAAYAIALLALGVRLASSGLRWASLALLMATIAKIFLYDVGELRDLYRVAALLGLALSLIAVSLVYQRFVFRRTAMEGDGP
ncbi:MAG TPA: DUF2339 domain-containing protein [Candidatus Binatia bacterium]|nr:DUF2339 domain-containing protein [Candidatus Binatia bacterium]